MSSLYKTYQIAPVLIEGVGSVLRDTDRAGFLGGSSD